MLVGNEVMPTGSAQAIFAAFVIISGQIIIAFIFGNMAALLSAMN